MKANNISQQKYSAGKERLLKVLRQWDRSGPAPKHEDLQNDRTAFDAWKKSVKDEGWTRKDMYDLINDIYGHHAKKFSAHTVDQLGEFETGITGRCDQDCIERFPGDPEDMDAFLEHVRGNKWR